MRKLFYRFLPLIISSVFLFTACGTKELDPEALQAKEAKRLSMFKEVDESLKTADNKAGVLFAPDLYKEGMAAYNDAVISFDKAKDQETVEKKIAKAKEKFDQASQVSDKSVEFFKDTKDARDAADKAGSAKLLDKNWLAAEKDFKKSIDAYKDGKTEKATELSRNALQLYRESELEGIKSENLAEAGKGIKELQAMGKKNQAPKTLKKAEDLVLNASSELDRQRYDNENAKKMAEEAEYEVRHANQINEKIMALKKSGASYEDLLLDQEESLSKIGNELGLDLAYDEGFDGPVAGITKSIQQQKKDIAEKDSKIETQAVTIADLTTKLTGKEQTVEALSRKSEDLKKQIKTAEELEKEREKQLQEELERQKMAAEELLREKQAQEERAEKLRKVQAILQPNEGKVLLEGSNIIVRLTGLTFASGKSAIEPQYFGLLSKTKEIIDNYERSTVTIQGHTDAVGNEKSNQKLSNDRAESVKQYFLANSDITEDRIKSVGFGSSQPVAKNTTKEGRAQNRRIDVVIRPAVE